MIAIRLSKKTNAYKNYFSLDGTVISRPLKKFKTRKKKEKIRRYGKQK